ncbi:MAG: flagellar biosynthesis protein FlhB [Deltaproteobacteria bacterium]|nr:flagellar biosynthesis protein FlhB [Deltaproteobacteria bacterium]
MAGDQDKFDKTERATPRRREDARRKGQVGKSKEVGSAVILISSLLVFSAFAPSMVASLREVMGRLLMESSSIHLSHDSFPLFLRRILIDTGYILFPLLILPVAGALANVMQIGLLFTTEPLVPKFSRLNPLEGIKRLFALSALSELLKSLFKMAVISYMAYSAISGEMGKLGNLVDMDTGSILSQFGSSAFKVLLKTSWLLIFLALVDYIYQKWEYERGLKMTKHEIKEESKETEGQPLVKSRIRSLQREMSRRRMMQDVPEATVVITNPTHLAIAIKYEQGTMRAPVVVAKGRGLVAEKIRAIARKSGVPTMENKVVAWALWKTVDIGREIPADLYKVVAEILAYIYKLKAGR